MTRHAVTIFEICSTGDRRRDDGLAPRGEGQDQIAQAVHVAGRLSGAAPRMPSAACAAQLGGSPTPPRIARKAVATLPRVIPNLWPPNSLCPQSEPLNRRLKLILDHSRLQNTPVVRELVRYFDHPDVELWTTDPCGRRWIQRGAPRAAGDMIRYAYGQEGELGFGSVQTASRFLAPIPRLVALGFPSSGREIAATLCLAGVSEAFQVDATVTDGATLLLRNWRLGTTGPLNLLTPSEALALIGLKARRSSKVVLPSGVLGKFALEPSDAYWTIARDQMPASRLWFALLMSAEDRYVHRLANGVMIRAQHALRARDLAQQELQFRHSPSAGEVLYHLDMLALSLAGAFDALAHVTEATYSMKHPPGAVGWRKPWVQALSVAAPALHVLVCPGSEANGVLDCLFEIRNLVHQEVLGVWRMHDDRGGRWEFELPDSKRKRTGKPTTTVRDAVFEAVERSGGASAWGLEARLSGGVQLEPGRFIEQLSVRCLSVLNSIMTAMDVGRLVRPGISPDPRLSPPRQQLIPEVHESLRMLSGLDLSNPELECYL